MEQTHFDDKEEAVRAVLDIMGPGDELVAHQTGCSDPDNCHCTPDTWKYPED